MAGLKVLLTKLYMYGIWQDDNLRIWIYFTHTADFPRIISKSLWCLALFNKVFKVKR